MKFTKITYYRLVKGINKKDVIDENNKKPNNDAKNVENRLGFELSFK